MKINIIYLLLIFGFFSCKKNIIQKDLNQEEIITMNQTSSDYDTLTNRVKKKGDANSYDELFYSFMDSNEGEQTDSLLIYLRIMAEKYNYDRAYFDYFEALCRKHDVDVDYSNYSNINISKMNEVNKKHALEWLNKMLKNKIILEKEFDSIKK